jgi:hypothetical protein
LIVHSELKVGFHDFGLHEQTTAILRTEAHVSPGTFAHIAIPRLPDKISVETFESDQFTERRFRRSATAIRRAEHRTRATLNVGPLRAPAPPSRLQVGRVLPNHPSRNARSHSSVALPCGPKLPHFTRL